MAKGRWRDYNDPREAISQSLLQQGMSNAPVTDWAGGLNRVLQSLLGAYGMYKVGKENDKVSAAMAGRLGISPEDARFLGEDSMRDMYEKKLMPDISDETFGTSPYMGADKKAYVRGNRGTVKQASEGILPDISALPTSVQEYQYGQQDPGFRAAQEQAQAMKRQMTPYQEGMLGLQRDRMGQSGQMTPFQSQSLDLQRQRLSQGRGSPVPETMGLLPVEQALSEGFPKGAVVQQNKKTGARAVLHKPEALGKPASPKQRAPLATTASDVDLARSFITGGSSGLRSTSGATPSDLSEDEQAILARHVADLGRGVQAKGGTFPGAVQKIAGKSRVDTIPLEDLVNMNESEFTPQEVKRAVKRLRSAGY